MKMTMISRRPMLKAGIALLTLLPSPFAGSLYAQTTPAPAQTTTDSQDKGEIVVTGSLIRDPNRTLSSPVNATTAKEISLRQSNNAEELLRGLPGVVGGLGSTVNLSNTGASFINLRGLGDNRNIVLLDGVRVVPADLQGRVDLNNIPLALIERVDVLTGGASTTYGADAISGVVNFVTNTRFTGLTATVSEQETQRGDGNTIRADLTAGKAFAEGRGNVILSVGYQKVDPVFQGDRAYSAIPYSSTTGTFAGSAITVPATFSLPGMATQQIRDGALVPYYAPFNSNTESEFQTGFKRYNAYGSARYQITDGIEIYARGLYSNNTVDVFAPEGGAFTTPVKINLSNPFLTASERGSFCSANGISVASCAAAALATNPADPAYRTVSTVLSRRVPEFGIRLNESKTNIYDFRAGLRGDITSTINWDVYGAYGDSKRKTAHERYGVSSHIAQSILAVAGPGGTPVCINTANNCVPVNWFGPLGSIGQREIDFIEGTWHEGQDVSLLQFNGKVSGNFGLSLPWSSKPISFAVGGEYRKYKASAFADALAQSGDVSGGNGAFLPFSGGYSVAEAVGELNVPIVQDRPLLREVTIEGGVRYSRYKVDAASSPSFNTTTWKVGGGWAPVEGLRFRGTFAHAVRAPNVDELFRPRSVVIGSLADDPCANINEQGVRIAGRAAPTGTLRDVCIAQGAPAGQIGSIQVPTAREVNTTIGGNITLRPEISDSYTVGGVFSPAALRRFVVSVDYYHIRVKGAITSPTPVDAINACFGDVSVSNPACTVIQRDPLTGSLRGSTQTVGGLSLALSNLGFLETDGIDLSVNYGHRFGGVDWSISATGNWTNHAISQATPTSVRRDCVGIFNTSCVSLQPEFQWSVRNTIAIRQAEVSLLWRHLDSLVSTVPLYVGPVPGLGDGTFDFNKLPSYDIFDLTSSLHVGKHYDLTFAVQNLFDKKPPLVGGTAGSFTYNGGNTFPSTYDTLGRRFVVTVSVKL